MFSQRGRSLIWIATAGIGLCGLSALEGVGLPFMRVASEPWKPKSVAVVAFGGAARRNLVDLHRQEVAGFLANRGIQFAAADPRRELRNSGYVVVRHAGLAIGCGRWCNWGLEPMVPKGKRIAAVDF